METESEEAHNPPQRIAVQRRCERLNEIQVGREKNVLLQELVTLILILPMQKQDDAAAISPHQ